ncbi:MAG TPA: ABC transporter substrate-binding protein [Candidatus Coproplasma stercorigallinarum]|nr:ABC transporter substrate-binding protein [Candidatus Coproplasma stercorigallinarum]
MKKSLIAVFAAALAALAIPFSLAGCGGSGEVLKINEVTHSVFYAPMYLADALGYYEEEGFEVEFTNGGGADNTMAAVLSGSADVGFCGPEAALYIAIGGSSDSPKVFGQLTKRDGSFMVARTPEPDFKWSDLEGKEILAGRKGGVPAMTFEYVIEELGVNASLNYDVDFNYMTAAFESGIADYCTMFEPTASDYEAEGKGYIVASVGEQSGEIPYTCFAAKESYINENPEKIEGLLRAVTKATKFVMENDAATVAEYLVPYFDGTSEESLANSVQAYKDIDAWVANMAMEEAAFTRLQDVIENSGELERRVDFDELILTDVAQKVYEEVYGI